MTQQKYTKTQKNDAKPVNSTKNNNEIVSINEIIQAQERIGEAAHNTPMDKSSTFAEKSGANSVSFKMENFQKTGAFKIRGAYNKISKLSEQEKNQGVIAASSGNHAQGVALAAQELGVDAKIVMPENTANSKIQATSNYGAEIILSGNEYEEAYQHAKTIQKEQNLTFIHPYNDKDVIAGQGTIGLEMAKQYAELDTVLVAVGGGGLISGIAAGVKARNPSARVIGVQTEGCGSAKQTLNSKNVYKRDSVDTVAKGIATRSVGKLPAKHMRELVDEVVYVSDKETKAASALLAERQKVVVEPAGAVAAAALLFQNEHGLNLDGNNVAVPICGANVDLDHFAEICQEGKKYLEEVF